MQERDNLTNPVSCPRPSVSASLLMVLLAAVGLWLTSLAVSLLPGTGHWQDVAANLMFYLPFIVLPIALYASRRLGISDALRFNPMPTFPMLMALLLAVVSVLAATELDYLWLLLLNGLGLREPRTSLELESGAMTLRVLNAAALPAICEELLFRGFVLSAWESRGARVAIVMSSALFALLHGNLFGLPAYFLVGVVSAMLVIASDSLYVGMVYHTAYNAAVLVMLYWASAIEKQGQAATAAGAEGFPSLFSIVSELMMVMVMLVALMTMVMRRRKAGAESMACVRAPLRRREWALLALTLAELLGTIAIVQLAGGGA